ncbi:MAG: hypothetical protein GDA46_02660 [Bdellovibrionales bacterium]|nr:hypothetical protein [Bdellovibrionales bacterium]
MKVKILNIKNFIPFIVIGCILWISYFYPRFLTLALGEKSPWISYLYIYGMGGVAFLLSLVWIFTRKKDSLRQKEEFLWLIALILGFLFIFFVHGLWIYISIEYPLYNP